MVDTKSRGYSNSGQLSDCGHSVLFFSTRSSPNYFNAPAIMMKKGVWNLFLQKKKTKKKNWRYLTLKFSSKQTYPDATKIF